MRRRGKARRPFRSPHRSTPIAAQICKWHHGNRGLVRERQLLRGEPPPIEPIPSQSDLPASEPDRLIIAKQFAPAQVEPEAAEPKGFSNGWYVHVSSAAALYASGPKRRSASGSVPPDGMLMSSRSAQAEDRKDKVHAAPDFGSAGHHPKGRAPIVCRSLAPHLIDPNERMRRPGTEMPK